MTYTLKTTHWNEEKENLSEIRRKVFIDEQKVPEELEWDEYDAESIHILASDNNTAIATGRMKPDGHIGRMAVLKEYRNKGVGSQILKLLVNAAIEQNLEKVYLHAQTSAIPFYEKQGFITCSDEFMDAGIPHKSMELEPERHRDT